MDVASNFLMQCEIVCVCLVSYLIKVWWRYMCL